MSNDRLGRKRLVIPLVIAATLIVDGGRAALSQQAGPDARVADAGAVADAGGPPDAPFIPPEGGGGCSCPGVS